MLDFAERMSIFPINPMVRDVRQGVLRTFDVSEQVAEEYAAMMVALAEDNGGPGRASQIDWDYRIKKDLGEGRKWPWRSDTERLKFEEAQRERYKANEILINKRIV